MKSSRDSATITPSIIAVMLNGSGARFRDKASRVRRKASHVKRTATTINKNGNVHTRRLFIGYPICPFWVVVHPPPAQKQKVEEEEINTGRHNNSIACRRYRTFTTRRHESFERVSELKTGYRTIIALVEAFTLVYLIILVAGTTSLLKLLGVSPLIAFIVCSAQSNVLFNIILLSALYLYNNRFSNSLLASNTDLKKSPSVPQLSGIFSKITSRISGYVDVAKRTVRLKLHRVRDPGIFMNV